jgi:hypothetical protein
MDESTSRLKLSKLNVGRRQLDAALDLWFSDYDPIPVHTLAAAAHEIFADICKHRGLPALMFDPALYRPGKAGVARTVLHKHYNFFKHANSDPEAFIDFPTELTEGFISMAIAGWRDLGGDRREIDEAFLINLLMRQPEIHRKDTEEHIQHLLGIKRLAQIMPHNRREFLKEFIPLYRVALAQRNSALTCTGPKPQGAR